LNKIVSRKNTNAIFLATVLVLGTIATISPSFMLGAQAELYYGMDDRYDSYEAEYTGSNSYEPTDYPSYKPEYQSDNSYKSKDSDFIKKIKCNNINSNLNGIESTTDVNGLLGSEGVSAQGDEDTSANAFGNDERNNNNGSFDVDCINNNNNNNAGGGQGAIGPPGPPGPAGPSQILPTNIYPAFGEEDDTFGDGVATSIATCDDGDTVLSGSYDIEGPAAALSIEDFALAGNNGWQASTAGPDTGEVIIETFAQCFDNPPFHMP
jgi:hypothetical protein